MTRIYIAGASAEIEIVKPYRDRLVELGFEITADWIAAVEANKGQANGFTDVEARRYADDDTYGIDRADVYWLLLPKGRSDGAWFEFGWACAAREAGIVIISGETSSIFRTKADRRFATHEEAFAWISMHT